MPCICYGAKSGKEEEKRCECKDCQAIDKLKADFDAIYTRVAIDMPFESQTPKSHARRLHDTKVLENAQKLKNIEDMDKKYECRTNFVLFLWFI